MKKLLTLVLLVGVAVLMTQTVPEKKAHKEAMMKAVRELVDEEAAKNGIGDGALAKFGKNIVNKAIETALGSKLKMRNYYLWNTGYIKNKGKEKLVSVGMFGHVFTFDKDMLREALQDQGKDADETDDDE